MYPYIFVDDDTQSETYGQFCVRISDTMSYDGFKTFEEAVECMNEDDGEAE